MVRPCQWCTGCRHYLRSHTLSLAVVHSGFLERWPRPSFTSRSKISGLSPPAHPPRTPGDPQRRRHCAPRNCRWPLPRRQSHHRSADLVHGIHTRSQRHPPPLVRTDHDLDRDDEDDEEPQEVYIVEPQTGDIFILNQDATRETPLRKLPYSVSQLVELSPFSFNDPSDPNDPPRTFVGKKETSIITLDLTTGAILGTTTHTLEKCRKGGHGDVDDYPEADDDFEDAAPRRAKRIEVQIGRTGASSLEHAYVAIANGFWSYRLSDKRHVQNVAPSDARIHCLRPEQY
jgi:hypothetical protein